MSVCRVACVVHRAGSNYTFVIDYRQTVVIETGLGIFFAIVIYLFLM